MKNIFAAAALIAAATSASAADLGRRPTAPTFTAVPVSSWTGFYVGVNGGYGQSQWKNAEAGSSDKVRGKGGLVGGTLGYNYQFASNIVAGVEADFGMFGAKKKESSTISNAFFRSTEASEVKTEYLGTLRARLGYSLGSFMPYLTGGLAFSNTKFKNSDTFTFLPAGPSFTSTSSASKSNVGFVAGFGLEAMVTSNISLKAEYLYAHMGSSKYTFTSSNGFIGDTKIKQDMHIGRIGVNYRF